VLLAYGGGEVQWASIFTSVAQLPGGARVDGVYTKNQTTHKLCLEEPATLS
jgi:hypothetical protein